MPSKYFPKSSTNSGSKKIQSTPSWNTWSRGSVPDSVMKKLDKLSSKKADKHDTKKNQKTP